MNNIKWKSSLVSVLILIFITPPPVIWLFEDFGKIFNVYQWALKLVFYSIYISIFLFIISIEYSVSRKKYKKLWLSGIFLFLIVTPFITFNFFVNEIVLNKTLGSEELFKLKTKNKNVVFRAINGKTKIRFSRFDFLADDIKALYTSGE